MNDNSSQIAKQSANTFDGLIAAAPTPLTAAGELNLQPLDDLCEHLVRQQVRGVFVCGSTGESHSLTVAERMQVAARWCELVRSLPADRSLRVIVHVGCNCLPDAVQLAAHAQQVGADAIAALSPSYFQPPDAETLIACCGQIAAAAGALPFYYYDIPSLTGLRVSADRFWQLAPDAIPNLRGMKFTNPDATLFLRCRVLAGDRFEILWGIDETLLSGLALGADGAVGSSYNVAAANYHRIIAAYQSGDLVTARREQTIAIDLIQSLARRGYLASLKAYLTMLGIDVGPVRLPLRALTSAEHGSLREELKRSGYLRSERLI